MNRKHNPLLALVALLLLTAIMVLICAGCDTEAAETEKNPDRLTVQRMGAGLRIITDTETGQQYLMAEMMGTSGGIGLTPLLPAEVAGNG